MITCSAGESLAMLQQRTDFWKVFIACRAPISVLIVPAVGIKVALIALERHSSISFRVTSEGQVVDSR
jgi:hypothetical protein